MKYAFQNVIQSLICEKEIPVIIIKILIKF